MLTFYGRTLLVKLALVVLVSVLGLANHHRLRRRDRSRLPDRTIALDACVATMILLLAGVLTRSQPAMEPEYVRDPAAAVVPVRDGAAGDLQETLAIRANIPGRNVVVATVFDTRRPASAPIRSVLITKIDPAGAAGPSLQALPPGGLGQQRAAVVSQAPIRDPLRAAPAVALVLAIAAAALGLAWTRRRRQPALLAGAASTPVPTALDPAPGPTEDETTSVLAGTRA